MGENQDSLLEIVRKKLKQNITQIENRSDLTEEEKISLIVKTFSATCAAIAIQPIPFADIFILTPIQAYMGSRIGAIRGLPISERKVKEIIKEIGGIVGLGLLAQQLVISGYKTFIPFLGAITTIPIVYGMTYAIGKVIDAYFIQKRKSGKIDPEVLKSLWKDMLKKGKKIGKEQADNIKKAKDEYAT
jgi:uncharacterized protein (DUF697 family)